MFSHEEIELMHRVETGAIGRAGWLILQSRKPKIELLRLPLKNGKQPCRVSGNGTGRKRGDENR